MSNGTIVITGQHIEEARLRALRQMLKLEISGLHRRGRSAYAIIKELTGLKGSKKSVLEKLNKVLG